MSFVTVGKHQFHTRLDGPEGAPVLILSNSLGTDLHMWDQQIPDWSKKFRVLRYDSRGHGKSAAPTGPYSIATLGRDALGIMAALGREQVHWCGLSMGGMVGQWLLTHAPARINRAVLANTAALMGPPDGWNTRIRAVNALGMAPITAALKDRWFTKRFQESDSRDLERIVETFGKQPPAGYAACCAAIRDMDQREAIRGVTTPTLVIIGSADPATPPACGELIHAHIKGSKKVVLDAAHLSNVEQPEAFGAAVLEFLK